MSAPRSPIPSQPLELPDARATLAASAVPSGARVSGAVADAIVRIDDAEHQRRTVYGLSGVDDLGLLDALMCLPTGASVSTADLEPIAIAHLRAAPYGCVDWLHGATRALRQLVPVASVELVIVRAKGWRAGLRQAAAFQPFASRVVLLDGARRLISGAEWEADAAGVGIWRREPDGGVSELVAPDPFVRRYVKPAGWRFTERAYTAWLDASSTERSVEAARIIASGR